MSGLAERLPDVDSLLSALDTQDYLADPPLGTALFLAARMGQPLLLEGEPGVGKTEAAKALARAIDTPLTRLPCSPRSTCPPGRCWPRSSTRARTRRCC